ncbi:hypothetical protein HPU229313_04400 [Helicobacter pullorum]|nr:hypothetical protein [Helicobacter pullorum]KPH52710.1 hypothetical protein HPU229313_04400 [Helicobacter pullorum]
MPHAFHFLRNNLFTSYTLEVDFPQIYDFEKNTELAKNALDSIKAIYNKEKFISQNEHQFEDDFISEVLEILGWSFIRQEEKIIQGKLEKPDFLLFTNQDSKNTYLQIPKEQRTANNEYFSVIAESKAYKVEIDNKKIKDNPHFQILRYLSNLKKDYGILTNGRIWRFYDNSKLSATKIFYEIDLEAILAMDNPHDESTLESSRQAESKSHILSQLQAFNYFYHIFHAKNFTQDFKEYKELLETMLETCHSKPFPLRHSEGCKPEESKSIESTIAIKDSLFATQIQNDGDISPNAHHDEIVSHSEPLGEKSKITKEQLEDSFIRYDREFFRLGFRAVASDTNERTLIFSLLPKNVGCGNSIWASIPKRYIIDSHGNIAIQSVNHKRLLFALGICNSLVVDYIARGMIQINVNKTYLERIPLPQPSDEELETKQDYIYKNALILQLYHDKAGDFEDLQKEFGIDKGQIPSTQKAYDTLRAKLDIHIAKLYGLSKEEFCAILESFKVLHDKQPHYITLLKRLWE